MQEEIRFDYSEGRYRIGILAVITADGISVTLTGGEVPHVGGTALSVPRYREDDGLTCDSWVTPRPGHRDCEAAALVSKIVCLETGQATACVSGIHIARAQQSEIELLLDNCRQAAYLLSHKIKDIIHTESILPRKGSPSVSENT